MRPPITFVALMASIEALVGIAEDILEAARSIHDSYDRESQRSRVLRKYDSESSILPSDEFSDD